MAALFWIPLFIIIAALISRKIKKDDEYRAMMSKVYTTHGHIKMYTLNTELQLGIDGTGYSVSSSGETFTHTTYKPYRAITGFTIHFMENFVMDDLRFKRYDEQPVTEFISLSKDQENPCVKYRGQGIDIYDGTLSYVIDSKGTKRFLSFTPDKA